MSEHEKEQKGRKVVIDFDRRIECAAAEETTASASRLRASADLAEQLARLRPRKTN